MNLGYVHYLNMMMMIIIVIIFQNIVSKRTIILSFYFS